MAYEKVRFENVRFYKGLGGLAPNWHPFGILNGISRNRKPNKIKGFKDIYSLMDFIVGTLFTSCNRSLLFPYKTLLIRELLKSVILQKSSNPYISLTPFGILIGILGNSIIYRIPENIPLYEK